SLHPPVGKSVKQRGDPAYPLLQLHGAFQAFGSERAHVEAVVIKEVERKAQVLLVPDSRGVIAQQSGLLQAPDMRFEAQRLRPASEVNPAHVEAYRRTGPGCAFGIRARAK